MLFLPRTHLYVVVSGQLLVAVSLAEDVGQTKIASMAAVDHVARMSDPFKVQLAVGVSTSESSHHLT